MGKSFRKVEGFLYLTEGLILIDLAKDRDCVEIGSYMGRSTLAIAKKARSVLAIDTFKGVEPYQQQNEQFTTLEAFLRNIEGCNNIDYKVGTSEEVLTSLHKKFNFAFIDGEHIYNTVKREIELLLPLMLPNSILCFHDYADIDKCPGVKKAVDEVFGEVDHTHKLMGWLTI